METETCKIQVRAPSFPHLYESDVRRMAHLLWSYSSSMFIWPEPKLWETGHGALTDLETKRDQLSQSDEHLRIIFLQTEVLTRVWDCVQDTRRQVQAERDHIVAEIESMQPAIGTGVSTRLPFELVLEICKLSSLSDNPNEEGLIGQEAMAAWGNVLLKSVRWTLFLNSGCMELIYVVRPTQRVLSFCVDQAEGRDIPQVLEENPWILDRRLELSLDAGIGVDGRVDCLRALMKFSPVFPGMERLLICNRGVRSSRPDDWGDHMCQGWASYDPEAPKLKMADIPLEYLPCLGGLFKSIQTLSVDVLLPIRASLARNFSHYFKYMDVTHLKSLSICGVDGVASQGYSHWLPTGPALDLPSLMELEINFPDLDGKVLISLFEGIAAEQLRTLKIYGLFWPEINTRAVSPSRISEMLTLADGKYRHIRQLSFYPPDFDYKSNCATERTDLSQGLDRWHLVSAEIFTHLGGSPEMAPGNVLFPRLEHLTIPIGIGYVDSEDLLRFLSLRQEHLRPVHTLEISIPDCVPRDNDRNLEIERLGLHVQCLLITTSFYVEGETS